jgi:hypothetical protein
MGSQGVGVIIITSNNDIILILSSEFCFYRGKFTRFLLHAKTITLVIDPKFEYGKTLMIKHKIGEMNVEII